MDRSEKILLFSFIGLICLCLCVAISGGIFLFAAKLLPELKNELLVILPTPTELESTEVIPSTEITKSALTDEISNETLDILKNTVVPSTDLITLAEKFKGMKNIPSSLTTPPVVYQLGDKRDFWTLNVDTNVNKKISATLAYMTDNVYFWVEDGIEVNNRDLKQLVETFANHIYPIDQEFFGKEWIPGVDNDAHLYILYARDLGEHLAGYNSDTDTVLPQAYPYANAHEMFAINADVQTLDDPYTLSVMAHEFQHLIHGYHDANEELWLNEGFSELATLLNGYDAGGFDTLFSYNPDIQLTEWPIDSDAADAHYGASFLFTTYLLDRFGEETTKAIIADPLNGLDSIDDVFKKNNVTDPQNGELMSADQLFMDWSLTNYLQDTSLAGGRFSYHNYSNAPKFSDTETISDCVTGSQAREVHQYGTDYIHFMCDGSYQLLFSGEPAVKVLPVDPIDGSHYIWSNKADVSDTTMTHEFDLSNVSGEVTLSYDMWYDLETDYDFAYLLASTDGQTWKILNTPSCTVDNISGNNYGCGYNGHSQGWQHETGDLTNFDGQKIWLRFDYVTDAAVTGEGLVLDNITIPQIGYQSSFESDNGGWDLQGFARIENQIPQTFLVTVIRKTDGKTEIEQHRVESGETLTIEMNVTSKTNDLTLVVSGATRYTRQLAKYWFESR